MSIDSFTRFSSVTVISLQGLVSSLCSHDSSFRGLRAGSYTLVTNACYSTRRTSLHLCHCQRECLALKFALKRALSIWIRISKRASGNVSAASVYRKVVEHQTRSHDPQ